MDKQDTSARRARGPTRRNGAPCRRWTRRSRDRTIARCLVGIGCIALAAGGCTARVGSAEAGSRTQGIADGELDDGRTPAVVVVFNRRTESLCSGTLITPRVVLTAKHCVQRSGAISPLQPSSFDIGVGDRAEQLTRKLTATEVRTTPGSYTSENGELGDDLRGVDVAVITLARGATVEPLPIRRRDPSELVGEDAIAVGFGSTLQGDIGVKYRATTRVDQVQDQLVFVPGTVCQGDSGGPLISPNGQVFGVASFGGECGSGRNGYNRIDPFLDMIDEAIDGSSMCMPANGEICDGFDNDCDGQYDEGCSLVGGSCGDAGDCVGGPSGGLSCESFEAQRLCTRSCNPLVSELGCPPGMYCDDMGDCRGQCAPGERGAKGYGEPCDRDTECASLFCAAVGEDMQQRCSSPCEQGRDMCFAGEVCGAGESQCGACVDAEMAPGPRRFGEPCGANGDCERGVCFTEEGFAESSSYCTHRCSDDEGCEEGFHCRPRGDQPDLCIRGPRAPRDAPTTSDGVTIAPGCVRNADCGPQGLCAKQGGRSWCTGTCRVDADCPSGYECSDNSEGSICVPTQPILGEQCSRDEQCQSGLCEAVEGGDKVCTKRCGAFSSCPTTFACHRADGFTGLCAQMARPGEGGGGGCAVALAPDGATSRKGLLLALLAWWGMRRRRSFW